MPFYLKFGGKNQYCSLIQDAKEDITSDTTTKAGDVYLVSNLLDHHGSFP
jgi:hypothetical protein